MISLILVFLLNTELVRMGSTDPINFSSLEKCEQARDTFLEQENISPRLRNVLLPMCVSDASDYRKVSTNEVAVYLHDLGKSVK